MTQIRPIHQSDLEDVQALAADPAIAATTNLPAPYPANGAKEWYGRIATGIAAGQQVVFAVINNPTFIGVMSLNAINHEKHTCALDYWIGKPFWGQGHGSRAAALAIHHAIHHLNITAITSACLTTNPGSQRVLEKCGFQFTETLPYQGPFPERFAGLDLRHYILEAVS